MTAVLKVCCTYGLTGAMLDTDDIMLGIIEATNQVQPYEYAETESVLSVSNSTVSVAEGQFITGVKLVGPLRDSHSGTLEFTDSSNPPRSYTVRCMVSTAGFAGDSWEYVSERAAQPGNIVTGFTISMCDDNVTAISDFREAPMPRPRIINATGAGFVTVVEEPSQGFVGLVDDDGKWQLIAEKMTLKEDQYNLRSFPGGYVLCGLDINRHSDGSASMTFTATDGRGNTQTIDSFQNRILGGIDARQHWSAPPQTITIPCTASSSSTSTAPDATEQLPQVIQNIAFWVVPGTNTIRDDFLVQGVSAMPFIAPIKSLEDMVNRENAADRGYYDNKDDSMCDNDGDACCWGGSCGGCGCHRWQARQWFWITVGCLVVLLLLYWIIRAIVARRQKKNKVAPAKTDEGTRAEGQTTPRRSPRITGSYERLQSATRPIVGSYEKLQRSKRRAAW